MDERARASLLTEARQVVLFYYKQHNREMSSLSKLTSEPTFCLTDPQPSKFKTGISLSTKSVFPSHGPEISAARPSWGNSAPVATKPVKPASLQALGLVKAAVAFPAFPLRKFFHVLPSSPPSTLTLAWAFLSSNSFVPSSSIAHNSPLLPEPLRTVLSLKSKRLSPFALRTTGCQALAAVLSALEKESR